MSPIDRDSDGDAIDEHAGMFSGVEQPREVQVEHRLPPWATGPRRKLFNEAIEGIADIIAGIGDHPNRKEWRAPREEPFASINHALAEMVFRRVDGVSFGRSTGEGLLETARYSFTDPADGPRRIVRPQWTAKARAPAQFDQVDSLVAIERAYRHAYDEMPPGMLDRHECELTLLMRYAVNKPPVDIFSFFVERLGFPEEVQGMPLDYRVFAKVARHGGRRVYSYLRQRGLVPEDERWEKKHQVERNEMANPVGYDCEGWTEIADTLGVHVRTAREWATTDTTMPVKKIMGRVYAKKAELAEWWEKQATKPGAA